MNNKLTVIDYGIGNIFSICNAFRKCGADVLLSSDKNEIENAQRLVLPGVGAFKDGMSALEQKGFDDAVRKFSLKERPFLGICLGMQMLMDISEEFGNNKGLGIIEGKVEKIIPSENSKIPHIGWSPVFELRKKSWNNTLLDKIETKTPFYFVHSFHAVPQNPENILAVCDYDGVELTAAVSKGNIFGCQFHPEKSGKNGLKIIEEFLKI